LFPIIFERACSYLYPCNRFMAQGATQRKHIVEMKSGSKKHCTFLPGINYKILNKTS
jgi:hypothetical protein